MSESGVRVETGTCDLCGQVMHRASRQTADGAWFTEDVWHPHDVERACPPQPAGQPPSEEWEAFYARYRPGRPGHEHFRAA